MALEVDPGAPGVVLVPALLTGLIAGSAVVSVYGVWASLDAVGGGGDSTEKAKTLANGVALTMTSAQYGTHACITCAGSLLGLTWQYHWSRGSSAVGRED